MSESVVQGNFKKTDKFASAIDTQVQNWYAITFSVRYKRKSQG